MGHFVLFPREQEKRDRNAKREEEKEKLRKKKLITVKTQKILTCTPFPHLLRAGWKIKIKIRLSSATILPGTLKVKKLIFQIYNQNAKSKTVSGEIKTELKLNDINCSKYQTKHKTWNDNIPSLSCRGQIILSKIANEQSQSRPPQYI